MEWYAIYVLLAAVGWLVRCELLARKRQLHMIDIVGRLMTVVEKVRATSPDEPRGHVLPYGRNPPEPVNGRPEPTPAPPRPT